MSGGGIVLSKVDYVDQLLQKELFPRGLERTSREQEGTRTLMRVRNTVNHEFESQLERVESVARHGGGGGDGANGSTWQ